MICFFRMIISKLCKAGKVSLFFLLVFTQNPSFAFLNKITEEQDAECKLQASYQTNDWSAKQSYKDCKKAFIKENKKALLIKRNTSRCFPTLFEEYENEIYLAFKEKGEFENELKLEQFMWDLNLNKEDNSSFILTSNQRYFLYQNGFYDFESEFKDYLSKNKKKRVGFGSIIDKFREKFDECIESRNYFDSN